VVIFVGRVRRVELEGGALVRLPYAPFHVLVALVDGAPVAIEDACNHAGASLSEGDRMGDCVSCPMHGYVFELRSGRLVEPRGLCGDQRTFVARFEGAAAQGAQSVQDLQDVTVWDPGSGVTLIGPLLQKE
jgi:nitrite reductase/ring-hydroxylating ferredoxin subunit